MTRGFQDLKITQDNLNFSLEVAFLFLTSTWTGLDESIKKDWSNILLRFKNLKNLVRMHFLHMNFHHLFLHLKVLKKYVQNCSFTWLTTVMVPATKGEIFWRKKKLVSDVPWVIQFSYRPGWKFSLKFQLCWGKKTLCCIKWNKHWQCRYSSLLPYPSILLKADNKTKSWPSFLSLR